MEIASLIQNPNFQLKGVSIIRPVSTVICTIFAVLSVCCDVSSSQAAEPAKVRVGYINNTQSAVMLQVKAIQKDENLDINLIHLHATGRAARNRR